MLRKLPKSNPLEELARFYYDNGDGHEGEDGPGDNDGSDSDGEGDGQGDNDNSDNPGGYGDSDFDSEEQTRNDINYERDNQRDNFGRELGENTPLGQETTDIDSHVEFDGFSTETEAADQSGYSIDGILGYDAHTRAAYNPTTGYTTVTQSFMGVEYDTHISPTRGALGLGDELGYYDELAADVLEVLGFEVTDLNIDIAQGIAEIAIGLITGMAIPAVALQTASVATDVAYSSGYIDEDTYNNIKATIAIAGIAYGTYTSMQSISVISQYNSMLGVATFAVTAYTAYSALQSVANKYGLDMAEYGIEEDLGIDGEGNGYEGVFPGDSRISGSVKTLVMRAASNMQPYEVVNDRLTSSIYNTNVDYSKEEAYMQSSYTDFRGGLNNVTAPHLIRKNEGQIYTNIDMSAGTIKSLKEKEDIEAFGYRYFIKTRLIGDSAKHLVSSTTYRQYAKMNGFLFFTPDEGEEDETFKIVRYKDSAIQIDDAVIPAPTVAPVIEAIGVDEVVKEIQTEYNYCYTYYSTDTGFESDPIYSDLWFATTQSIKVTKLTGIDNEFIDKIRLYRIGGYTTVYRLVEELDNPGDAVEVDYVDELHGSDLGFNLDTYKSGDVIVGLVGLTENRGTLFAYKDNKVYFTSPGKPNSWNAFNYIRFNDTITGLGVTPIGVLVFTTSPTTYILGGLTKRQFSTAMLSKSISCVSYKSVQNIKNASIWLAAEGIMMSLGSSIQNITKSKVDTSTFGAVHSSIVVGDLYYLICENTIFVVDFSYNTPAFRSITNPQDFPHHQMSLSDNELLVSNGSQLSNMYGTTADRELEYYGPLFIYQNYDTIKAFSKVSIAYNGVFQFIIYLDGAIAVDETLDSNGVTDVAELNLLAGAQEGKGLSVYIKGTGEIFNIREIYDLGNLN